MKEDIKQKSLIQALSYCSVRDLPEEDNGENVWVKAIGLVSKIDGTKSYVAIERGVDGGNKIVKDFGHIASIVKVENVYPYLYLESGNIPKFKTNSREDRIAWLRNHDLDNDYSDCSLKKLNAAILNICCQSLIKNKI